MNTKQFHRRTWAIVLLLALMVTAMGATLYDLQINNGEENYQKTQKKIAEAQTIPAARGFLQCLLVSSTAVSTAALWGILSRKRI